uniref:Uncharacterized protein n=1 Tax=Nelumbo nucifera TaxID=4432 RepID=A0A822XLH2_NELNU|nr:TPA_asm: hypothetical protein HUJ06_021484 [Nelumbo nucifera]
MTMTFDGCQWNKLAQLDEPRFMADGFVFKGEVWILEIWSKHLQSLEEKVPCVVCFKGRMFGLKMGSNMVVVWDEGRKGWGCLDLIGRAYVEKGFKGKILGVGEDSITWHDDLRI